MFIDNNNFFTKVNSLVLKHCNLKIAVAVSGGIDSTTLALLLKLWSIENINFNITITAIIIDHKLRKESATEAENISLFLKNYNIESVILQRDNTPILTKIQEQARFDRYKLLTNFCIEKNIPYLFVGHHLDDDLETYVMRKSKGENLIGLSGINEKVVDKDITIIRPFLSYTKQQIINIFNTLVVNHKHLIANDPSNFNLKFERVKVRNNLANKNKSEKQILLENLTNAKLNRQKLEADFIDFFTQHCFIDQFGCTLINFISFKEVDTLLQAYILYKLLQYVGGEDFIKFEKIKLAIKDILNNKKFTLAKCIVALKIDNKKQYIKIYQEKEFILKAPVFFNFYSFVNLNNYIVSLDELDKSCFNKNITIKSLSLITDTNLLAKIKQFYLKYKINLDQAKSIPIVFTEDSGVYTLSSNLLLFKSKNILYQKFF